MCVYVSVFVCVLCCAGHKDSVTCTGFSGDGKYLATGDMGGRVRVWGVEDRQPVCSFEASDLEVSTEHRRGKEGTRRRRRRE